MFIGAEVNKDINQQTNKSNKSPINVDKNRKQYPQRIRSHTQHYK